jgi:UDP-N-acetylmuramoyl-tripeptide--D-alanyl-D-alanine ligase
MDRKTTVTLKLPGSHFVSNALAAASIAYTFDISVEDIKTGLEAFQGVPGRMETIHMSGMTIINDTYNANPVSMEASLQALSAMTQSKRKIAVLGDMLELGKESKKFHQQVGELASQLKIDHLLLIGAFSSQTRDGAVSAGMDKNRVILFDNIPALGKHLKENMSVGDSILMKGSRKMALDKLIEYLKHNESR